MTKRGKKLILTILVAMIVTDFMAHLLAYEYFFSISPGVPNTKAGQISLLNQHGSLCYITYPQQLFLNITEYTFIILFLITFFLGVYWKLFHPYERDVEKKYYEYDAKNVNADFVPRYTSEKKPYLGIHHNLLIGAGLFCLIIGISTISGRYFNEMDGTIISYKTVADAGPKYLFRYSQGYYRYVDGFLPNGIPAGTHIKKEKYKFAWQMNERIIDDFPLRSYIALCVLGIVLALWGFKKRRVNTL